MFNVMEKHVSRRSSGGILPDQRIVREICTQISGGQMDASSLRRIVCTIEHRDACVPTLGFC
jgi:hypothetical protein